MLEQQQQEEEERENNKQSYLKLSLNSVELYNHLVFYFEENNNNTITITDDIEMVVWIEFRMGVVGGGVEGDSNSNNEKEEQHQQQHSQQQTKLQEMRLKANNIKRVTNKEHNEEMENVILTHLTTTTNNNNNSNNNRWDCIKLNNELVEHLSNNNNNDTRGSDIKCELIISYGIVKGRKEQQRQQQEQQQEKQHEEKLNENNKKYIRLLTYGKESQSQITFSIDKIIRQSPYAINEVNVDLCLFKENDVGNSEGKGNNTNNNNNSNNNTRDGLINLSIIYLPRIQPQIIFKNIILTTKSFSNKGFVLNVKQVFGRHEEEDQYLYEGNRNKNNNNNRSGSKEMGLEEEEHGTILEITLPPTHWQRYENLQSTNGLVHMPLVLHNNHDMIEFTLNEYIVNNNNNKNNNNIQKHQEEEVREQEETTPIQTIKVSVDELYDGMVMGGGSNSNSSNKGKSNNNWANGWAEFSMNFTKKNNTTAKEPRESYQLRFSYIVTIMGLDNNKHHPLSSNIIIVESEQHKQEEEKMKEHQHEEKNKQKQNNNNKSETTTKAKSLIEQQQYAVGDDIISEDNNEYIDGSKNKKDNDVSDMFLLLQSGFGNK